MEYEKTERGVFIKRLNRFTASVRISGIETLCHVKNTGRLRELLTPGAEIFLQFCDKEERKTKWDLFAVRYGTEIVNIDSQAPNKAAGEWLRGGGLGKLAHLRPETVYETPDGEKSRFDFYMEFKNGRKAFMEVKGVTLVENGTALFPDAPTERGVKHVKGLISCKQAGFDAYVLFVIQRKDAKQFSPNEKMHAAFAEALREAAQAGVQVLAMDCRVSETGMTIADSVPVRLSGSA